MWLNATSKQKGHDTAEQTFPVIHVRTPLELSEVATALYDRISTVTPDDVSVFGMSNPQPPAEPTLGEQVSDRIAAAHRLRAPVGAALE